MITKKASKGCIHIKINVVLNKYKNDIIIFTICFLILSSFLYIFSPGILSYDSYNQLTQIKNCSFDNWHPFFHTFIEMILLKFWNNPSIIGLFQIITFSLIWTGACHYTRKEDSKKTIIIQIVATILIVLNPINFLYAITLWKDILYSYFILLVSLLIKILIDKNYNTNRNFIILFAITLAFLGKIRYNGLYIAIILMVLFSLLLYKNVRKHFILLPLITILSILSISSLNILYNVKSNEKDAIEPKVMQYLTYYIKNKKISKKDLQKITKVANKKALLKNYSDSYTDNTYGIINHKEYKRQKKVLLNLCIKYSLKYPLSSMDFALKTTSFIWNPTFTKKRIGLIITTDINSTNNIENIQPYHKDEKYYQSINTTIQRTLENDITKILLYSAALYFYLTIIIAIILKVKWKYKTLLIILPNILNLIIIALSNPIHDIRYIYPNILIFYFFILILIEKAGKNDETNKKINE